MKSYIGLYTHNLCPGLGLLRLGFEHPIFHLWGELSNPLRHRRVWIQHLELKGTKGQTFDFDVKTVTILITNPNTEKFVTTDTKNNKSFTLRWIGESYIKMAVDVHAAIHHSWYRKKGVNRVAEQTLNTLKH